MTLFEVGVVIAIVVILVAVLLPGVISNRRYQARPKSAGVVCVNNLKQIGLAYRIWAGDNREIYPMGISVTNGGSMEMVTTGNVTQSFLVMSNELSTPKILFCPADLGKVWATNFASVANSNISYFIGVDATNDLNPQMLLSGDGNFEIGNVPVRPGLRSFWTNDPVAWTINRHGSILGNIGLADGSVKSATIVNWHYDVDLQRTGFATNRLAIP